MLSYTAVTDVMRDAVHLLILGSSGPPGDDHGPNLDMDFIKGWTVKLTFEKVICHLQPDLERHTHSIS